MIQIREPDDAILNVLQSTKKSASEHFRLLTFCLQEHTDDGLLLYNTLTGEILLLNEREQEDLAANEGLREKWFVVPQELDDLKLARQIRQMMTLLQPQCPIIKSYTILTTTDCNARCFYCYEKGRSRIPMTEETANRLSDWIIDNYRKLQEWTAGRHRKDKDYIGLHWFGGEPLCNIPVIDTIVSRLRDADVNFHSLITSNSYLFDEAIVKKAAVEWNLKSVQVTLDGTEDVYNRCKAFIYSEGSAYKRVIRNIALLLNAGIEVSVRLNIDVHNSEDLMELADVLHDRFGSCKNFGVYSHPLFELEGSDPKPRSAERRADVYKRYQALQDKLYSLGLLKDKGQSIDNKTHRCMADSISSVLVLPTGHLGRCEHYIDSDFYAHLDNPDDKDMAVYRSFEENCDVLPLCSDCVYYPKCIRLKKCPIGNTCYPENKADIIEKLRRILISVYKQWKENSKL